MCGDTIELVARVIASTGRTIRPDAMARARAAAVDLLERDGLEGLSRADAAALASRLVGRGYTPRSATSAGALVAAAFELGRRLAIEQTRPRRRLVGSPDVAEWAAPRLSHLAHEELWMLALDGRSQLRAASCVAKGGLHGLGVRAADPLRAALRADASAMILVHNHPSGDPTPSAEDVAFTASVTTAARAVGLPLVDHVIVAREGFASVPYEPPVRTSSEPNPRQTPRGDRRRRDGIVR
jgi:DNA repair protein RadC